MRKTAVSFLLGAAALWLVAPANAEGLRSSVPHLQGVTSTQQVDVSSRRYRRVVHRRVISTYRRGYDSFAFAPAGLAIGAYPRPYWRDRYVSYNSFDPFYDGPYASAGYDSFVAPGPGVSFGVGYGGYGPYDRPYHWGGPAISVGFGGGPLFW
jgi:hypothetical protein